MNIAPRTENHALSGEPPHEMVIMTGRLRKPCDFSQWHVYAVKSALCLHVGRARMQLGMKMIIRLTFVNVNTVIELL